MLTNGEFRMSDGIVFHDFTPLKQIEHKRYCTVFFLTSKGHYGRHFWYSYDEIQRSELEQCRRHAHRQKNKCKNNTYLQGSAFEGSKTRERYKR